MNIRPHVLATLEGYAVEGGLDRPHEPATCFRPTISLGRHLGPGDADGLWERYDEVLDLVAPLGLDGVRITVEWARIEPRRGVVDDDALERYREVVRYARSLGLDVTVAMFDAAWPAWLGLEAWLLPWIVPYALAHAQLVGARFGELATGLVTFTDRASLVRRGFIEGTAPPWRRGGALDARSALAQIERIDQSLATSETLGPRLVASSRTIDLDLSRSEFAQQYALGARCHEIYVRSLVQGHGPTSAPAGLLERHDNSWATGASAQLLDLFR